MNSCEELLKVCLRLDRLMLLAYQRFARHATEPQIHDFWLNVAEDEAKHLRFWQNVLPLGRNCPPELFLKEPDIILKQLQNKFQKIRQWFHDFSHYGDLQAELMFAFVFEAYLLDSAFVSILRIFSWVEPLIQDDYELHINKFVVQLERHCNQMETIPLIFLSEILCSMNAMNKTLILDSMTDPLTGLLNRRGFSERLRPALYCEKEKYSSARMLLLDVDDFKTINDTYGHPVGDQVLAALGLFLRENIGPWDLASRHGGDEFLLCCRPALSGKSIGYLAEFLRKGVAKQLSETCGIAVSISIGISSLGVLYDSLSRKIEEADRALYLAKRQGKNCCCGEHA